MSYSFRPRELIAQSHSTAKYFEAINAKQAADDLKRVRFLERLKQSNVKLTGWERTFIDGCARQTSFSRGQATIIDKLFHRYGRAVK